MTSWSAGKPRLPRSRRLKYNGWTFRFATQRAVICTASVTPLTLVNLSWQTGSSAAAIAS